MKYVIAVNRKEAESLAALIGHDSKREAEAHLAEVQGPPTDDYYASQYRVYAVLEIQPHPATGDGRKLETYTGSSRPPWGQTEFENPRSKREKLR